MYQRQLEFGEAIRIAVMEKYCCFEGRASRSEFWWAWLFFFLVSFAVSILCIGLSDEAGDAVTILVGLAFLLPQLGVQARRLHDTGKSAWWLLLHLICFIGSVVLLILCIAESEPYANEYGPVPNAQDNQGNGPDNNGWNNRANWAR